MFKYSICSYSTFAGRQDYCTGSGLNTASVLIQQEAAMLKQQAIGLNTASVLIQHNLSYRQKLRQEV